MKKSKILFAIVSVCLQSFIDCKPIDISPQSLSQQTQNLVEENKLIKINKLPQFEPIIYLKRLEEVSKFFFKSENRKHYLGEISKSRTQLLFQTWVSPRAENGMSVRGIFTFPDKNFAEMNFDKEGNISALTINDNAATNISYEYDSVSGYLTITKWGIIALPKQDDLDSFITTYDYYYAPITRWEASLASELSTIQHMDAEANLTVEDFGKFEIFYTSVLPVTEPLRPTQEKFRDNLSNQIVTVQN